MTAVRLLVIEHESEDPIGLLGERFTELGVELDVRRGHAGELVPTTVDPSEHQGIVVLGGYMGADDDEEHAWLTHTKALLRWVVETDAVPVLGICLGHQLLGSALGGRVARNPSGRAIGLTPVGLLAEGHADPLLAGTDGALALQYNDDIVIEPPPGVTVLARTSDGAAQAIRYGTRAWGVQFHPEVTPQTFGLWSGVTEEMLTATYAAEPALRHTWAPLADRFAALAAS